jgi:hypothetical protein
MSVDINDSSILYLIGRLKENFEKETYDYSFYDFEKTPIKEKNKLYLLLERISAINNKNNKNRIINNSNNELYPIYNEINKELEKYEVTNICNIKLGRLLKYKNNASEIPIQLYEGYYYSFTINCKKIR